MSISSSSFSSSGSSSGNFSNLLILDSLDFRAVNNIAIAAAIFTLDLSLDFIDFGVDSVVTVNFFIRLDVLVLFLGAAAPRGIISLK